MEQETHQKGRKYLPCTNRCPKLSHGHPRGWGDWALGSLRSGLCQEGPVTPSSKKRPPIKPSYSLGFMGWHIGFVAQESTSSCHIPHALAFACRGGRGELIKSLL